MASNTENIRDANKILRISIKQGKELKQQYDQYCERVYSETLMNSGSRKLPPRNNYFLCKEHINDTQWSQDKHGRCNWCIRYGVGEIIMGGMLLTGQEVLSRLLTMKSQNSGRQVNNEYECATELYCHWVNCNIYPISCKSIAERDQGHARILQSDKKV